MNTTDTLEERFRAIGAGSVRFMATRQEVLDFIKSEQSKLIEDILAKQFVPVFGRAYVTVAEILEIADQHGIISNDKNEL